MKNAAILLIIAGCALYIRSRSIQFARDREQMRVESDEPAEVENRMIPVDIPAPVFPAIREEPPLANQPPADAPGVAPAPPTPEPLRRDLVTVSATDVRVQNGAMKLNAGVPVLLVRDRGTQVDVRWLGRDVTVPRGAVQNSGAISATPAASQPTLAIPPMASPAPGDSTNHAPPDRVAVSAHEVGTSKSTDRVWLADNTIYDKNSYRTKALEVEIRNLSRQATGDCQVMVYWAGKRMTPDHSIFIHHGEMLPANIAAATSATARFWCPLLAGGDTHYVLTGTRELDGSRIDGWFVLVSRAGHTLGGVASSPTYERLLASSGELEKLLANYHPDGRTASAEMPHWRDDPLRKTWTDRHGTGSPVSANP